MKPYVNTSRPCKQKFHRAQPPTAYCDYHDRYVNDFFIHKRRCVLRMCKHLSWLGGNIIIKEEVKK